MIIEEKESNRERYAAMFLAAGISKNYTDNPRFMIQDAYFMADSFIIYSESGELPENNAMFISQAQHKASSHS